MSIVVEGVIDLPFVDLRDVMTIHELLLFLEEQGVLSLKDWDIKVQGEKLMLSHRSRNWSWIELCEGKVRLDAHYKETEKFKDQLLDLIREFYPMYKKALEIIEKNNIKDYRLSYNKEKDRLVLEVEE